MIPHLLKIAVSAALLLSGPLSFGQAPGVPIEPTADQSGGIMKQTDKLKSGGRLLSGEAIAELIVAPVPEPLHLPAPLTEKREAREVAGLARSSYMRVGWYFLCGNCDHWHLNLGGGYATDPGGAVATCAHVIQPYPGMREGYIVAVDIMDRVYPVSSVLACDPESDSAIVRLADASLIPLPLQENVHPGDEQARCG